MFRFGGRKTSGGCGFKQGTWGLLDKQVCPEVPHIPCLKALRAFSFLQMPRLLLSPYPHPLKQLAKIPRRHFSNFSPLGACRKRPERRRIPCSNHYTTGKKGPAKTVPLLGTMRFLLWKGRRGGIILLDKFEIVGELI
jgi:hypothetical protein